jgi:hypothetical protein
MVGGASTHTVPHAQGDEMSRLAPVVGTEIVDDIRLGHTMYEYEVLKEFVMAELPQWFIEIGVHEGGLAWLAIPVFTGYMKYIGVEIDCQIVRPEVKTRFNNSPDAELICANCFSGEVEIRLSSLVGSKLIYCDGGNKVKELHHFKQFCNPGDVIMAHDFWDSDRKVHGVPEIRPEVLPMDVLHLDISDNFTRLNENIFKETRIIGWRKNNE